MESQITVGTAAVQRRFERILRIFLLDCTNARILAPIGKVIIFGTGNISISDTNEKEKQSHNIMRN